jgi:hypothetical protein
MLPETPFDKAKFTLTVQAGLITVFAYLTVGDLNQIYTVMPILSIISKFLPIAVCLFGIAYSIYSVFSKEVAILKAAVYWAVPIILGVGWVSLFAAFSLEAFGLM